MMRKQAKRKRTREGQRTMFSLKIWAPRKPLSLGVPMLSVIEMLLEST